jgi:PadR family transcriptional regulator PadR
LYPAGAVQKAGLCVGYNLGDDAAEMIVVEGTLYPLLTRLKNDGYLSYKWEESQQGPPRKYYELTETGRLFLNELEASWTELVEAINHLRNNDNL